MIKRRRVGKRTSRHGGGDGEPLSSQVSRLLGEFWADPVYRTRLLLAAVLIAFALVFVVVA